MLEGDLENSVDYANSVNSIDMLEGELEKKHNHKVGPYVFYTTITGALLSCVKLETPHIYGQGCSQPNLSGGK